MPSTLRKFAPRRALHLSARDRWQFFALGIATIFEGLVMTLSLGYLTVDTRVWLMFEVFDDDE